MAAAAPALPLARRRGRPDVRRPGRHARRGSRRSAAGRASRSPRRRARSSAAPSTAWRSSTATSSRRWRGSSAGGSSPCTSSAAGRGTGCSASSRPTPPGRTVVAGPVEATAAGNVAHAGDGGRRGRLARRGARRRAALVRDRDLRAATVAPRSTTRTPASCGWSRHEGGRAAAPPARDLRPAGVRGPRARSPAAPHVGVDGPPRPGRPREGGRRQARPRRRPRDAPTRAGLRLRRAGPRMAGAKSRIARATAGPRSRTARR